MNKGERSEEREMLEKDLEKKIFHLVRALLVLFVLIYLLKRLSITLNSSSLSEKKIYKNKVSEEVGSIEEDLPVDDIFINDLNQYDISDHSIFSMGSVDSSITSNHSVSEVDYAFLDKGKDINNLYLYDDQNNTREIVHKGKELDLMSNWNNFITFIERNSDTNTSIMYGYPKEEKSSIELFETEGQILSYTIKDNTIFYTLKGQPTLYAENIENNKSLSYSLNEGYSDSISNAYIVDTDEDNVYIDIDEEMIVVFNKNKEEIDFIDKEDEHLNFVASNISINRYKNRLKSYGFLVMDNKNDEIIYEGVPINIKIDKTNLYIKDFDGIYVYNIESENKPLFIENKTITHKDYVIFNNSIHIFDPHTREMNSVKINN